jgi:hypothetical protein
MHQSPIAGGLTSVLSHKPFNSWIDHVKEQHQNTAICRATLKTPQFDEIRSREEAISPTHVDTFSWVFDDNATNFKSWATSQNGKKLLMSYNRH